VRPGVTAPARRALSLVLAAFLGGAALATLGGCAYFNTFYAARKNFEVAEVQSADPTDPDAPAAAGAVPLYDKAMVGATKLIVQFPKSKWVDDSMLLIGRCLLAKGDYQGAQLKFDELARNFPKSDLKDQATYWSGVAADRDHRRADAIALYDSLIAAYPKSKLRDDAQLRRATVYLALKQPQDAIPSLDALSRHKGAVGYQASLKLAEAWYAQGDYTQARTTFGRVAEQAPNEQLRLDALLRAGDCDEALGDYTHAAESYLELSRTARTPDAKAQARLRYGSALALAGQVDRGLTELRYVTDDFPRSNYAAEAMFRIGYLNEVVRDDIPAATKAYDGVAQQASGSPFVAQARSRRDNLSRLSDSLSVSRDTTAAERAAQSAFRLAEHELFQLSRPAKAADDYAIVERDHPQSPLAPRAALARAWVLGRRLGQPDSSAAALKAILDRYPGTPSAKAAQRMLDHPTDSTYALDNLVGSALVVPLVPGRQLYVPPAPVTTQAAAAARGAAARRAARGAASAAAADSLRTRRAPPVTIPAPATKTPGAPTDSARADTSHAAPPAAPAPPPPAPRDTSAAGSTR
jgi:TolA-binding protein